MSTLSAVSTSSFLQSVGVNTNLDNTASAYANTAEVESELNYLGVKNVRDSMAASNDGSLFQSVAAATGVKFDVFLSNSAFGADGQICEMSHNLNIIKYVEGENEADTWPITYHGLTGFAAIAATQQALYTMATTTAGASGVGIIGPSYGVQSSFAQAVSTASTSTYGNTHEYWGTGNPPGATIPGMISNAQLVSGTNPIVASEAGYYTGASLLGTGQYAASGVDELVQAKYDLTVLFDDWQHGIQSTYLFDLMDIKADPNNTNYQDHYGLFNADGTPKLAAVAIHNLFTVLGGAATNAPSVTGTLGYQITGMPATASSMEMQNSSGAYDIALWNDVRLWSATSPVEINNPALPITVNFGQLVQSVTEYDPIAGTSSVMSWSNVSSVSLGLLDHPIILEVTPYASGTFSLNNFVLSETVGSSQSTANLWSQLIGNAADADPNQLAGVTISSVGTSSTSGVVTFNATTQSLTYQAPVYNPFHPTDSLTYTLTNANGDVVTGTVAITETPAANTTYGTLAGANLTAPSTGWTLDSMTTGETLYDNASGGDTLVAYSDSMVYASGNNDTIQMGNGNHGLNAHGSNTTVSYGNGNNTIGLSGSGYTITTGNGNNLVWKSLGSTSITMGNGNQVITVGGLHNTISIGTGASTINAGSDGNAAGYEQVSVAGGTNVINVGGTNDTVAVGGGVGNKINASGGAARITVGSGSNTINAANGANNVVLLGGSNVVTLTGNGNVVTGSGVGSATVYSSGAGDTIKLGNGNNGVGAHGSNDILSFGNGNNTIGLSGSGYTVTTGNGNNVVWKSLGSTSITMGNGNQAITVGGANNTISIGTGTSTINAGNDGSAGGYEQVTVGGGTNTISVGGAHDTVQVGGGIGNKINASGGSAKITAAGTSNTIVAANGMNQVTLLGGSNVVTLTGNSNVLNGSGAGAATVYSSGTGDTITLGNGNNGVGALGSNDILSFGNGNNTIGLSGTGYTVTTRNGNNVVWKSLGSTSITMGNGNQTITVGGVNNTISIGTGTSTINAGTDGSAAGYEQVTVAGGTNTINVGGANDTVVVGGGTGNAIVANGTAATITIDGGSNNVVAGHGAGTITLLAGTNTVVVAGNANILTGGSGTDSIWVGGNTNIITAGAGTETLTAAGQGDVINLTQGSDTLSEQGSHNTIALAAAGGVAAQINGNVVAAGDIFDLRTALGATSWSGSSATLSNYLQVTDVGSKSIISIAASGTGAGTQVAVLNNSANLTLQKLLTQAILPGAGNSVMGSNKLFVHAEATKVASTSGLTDFQTASVSHIASTGSLNQGAVDNSFGFASSWHAVASTEVLAMHSLKY